MSNEQKSIFEFANKFGYESPFGYWLKSPRDKNKAGTESIQVKDILSLKQQRNGSVVQKGKQCDGFSTLLCAIRVGYDKQINKFMLRDGKGKPIRFDKEDKKEGIIYLPQGTLFTKLNENPNIKNYFHVIAWFEGAYREGYLHSRALESPPSKNNPFKAEVFKNDIQHLLFRVNQRLKNEKSGNDFNTLFLSVVNDIDKILNEELKIDNSLLDKVKKQYESETKIDLEDRVKTLEIYKSIIKNTFNPSSQNGKHSDITLTLPLYEDWLKQDKDILKYYNETWINGSNGYLNRLGGASGEGDSSNEGLAIIKKELINLKSKISQKSILKNSNIGKWLEKIDSKFLEKIKTIIFIHSETWEYNLKTKYASYIALENTFGDLKAIPLHTVLLHEYNVNFVGDYFPADTHNADFHAKEVWEKACEGKFFSDVIDNPEELDHLFQSNSYLALACLAYFIALIRKLQ